MIRACAIALLLGTLVGCAGQASYRLRPFVDPNTGQIVCCEVLVTSSRDVQAVHAHATKDAAGNLTLDVTETGISASAPIQAQNGAISSVAGAVSNTAAVAAKLIP